MPSNMSRGYYKLNSRKPSQGSLQFDKLFHENSNRPSAAKSAGTIGRWGVISCTSLRSTNIIGRKEEEYGAKRMRLEFSGRNSQLSSRDPFSFESSAVGPPPVVKPRKFFKSRNIDSPPDDGPISSPAYNNKERSSDSTYKSKVKKYGKNNYHSHSAGSKKVFGASVKGSSNTSNVEPQAEQTEAMNLTSPAKTAVPPREENKPPIVLRIFKGTSHLVSVPSSPCENSSGISLRSSTRKRSHSSDSRSVVMYSSSIITAPKRSTRELRSKRVSDSSFDYVAEVSQQASAVDNLNSSGSSTNSNSSSGGSSRSNCASNDCLDLAVEDTTKNENECLPENPVERMSSPIANVENSPVPVKNEQEVVEADDNQPLALECPSVNTLPLQENVEHFGEQCNGHQEQYTEEPVQMCNSIPEALTEVDNQKEIEQMVADSPQPPDTKTLLDQDWFSDSDDCSDSISDHINTIASTQGEGETESEITDGSLARVLTQEKCELDTQQESGPESGRTSPADKQSPPPSPKAETRPMSTRISPIKKGSIFKSRSLLSGSKKRLALYKHKWADDKEGGGGATPEGTSQSQEVGGAVNSVGASVSQPCLTEEDFEPSRLTRVTSWPLNSMASEEDQEEAITSVKCSKNAKGYYTVVRNVKKAHQIQESGEFQEFNDDVEYILDALQDNNPIGTRCLSAITLASKCMAPAFRMHVRAHGTVAKFFRALHDATRDQSLGLCTATVMFVLSQDRLNMDLDRDSLELMLGLLECDASHHSALDDCGMSSVQLAKNKEKVRELCAAIQSQGHAKYLDLDNITVGHLAMETLLSLTSRRAGEWFKEELRELGGLEHIVRTICDCCTQIDDYVVEWTEVLLNRLRKVDRCLRVLENVTHQNEENQLYLLRYSDGILVDTLMRLYCQCDSEIPLYPVTNAGDKESAGAVIREALLATLKVLINLSHDFNDKSFGSTLIGRRHGAIDASLHIMLQLPNYVPEEKKFELLVLSLLFLTNLVEHNTENRKILFEARAPAGPDNVFHYNTKSAVEALVTFFYQQEQQARVEEGKTDAILDGKKDAEVQDEAAQAPKTQEEFIEETVAKLLQKAGRNMEHTLIGAYVGLLLGYLVIDNKDYEHLIRQYLPEGNFKTIVGVLQKVYDFMNLTASAVGSSRGIAQTRRIINFLVQCDGPSTSDQDTLSSHFSLSDNIS
ncbi:protein wings apart-like [Schistocerca gregaria]|uniref:protein wings apart-like n=1 Tax=Schistocerca gregaria TaxID=7010 RepID=UPI00211DB47A|nr:protein wings apart-like [Schistocerca gregaria]